MLFLCVRNEYREWLSAAKISTGFLEGNSYRGHYVGGRRRDMINLICPVRGAITTYGKEILDIMVEDPENEEKR